MKKLHKIGVLGGMGPEATVLFMKRIIALTDAGDDADHIPLLVDMNTQIPSRIAALINKNGVTPGPTLANMASGLEQAGAMALAMPCNTAHYYADYITDASTVPFFNMIELSAQRISKLAIEDCTIGVLASPATYEFDIFQNVFDRYGLKSVFAEESDEVLAVIRKIKSDGVSPELAGRLSEIVKELEGRGAQCLLVGCSEFSLFTGRLSSSLPVFDSVDILAQKIVEFSGAELRSHDDAPRFT